MLKDNGVLLSSGSYMKLRAVTHLDVSMKDVEQAVEVFYKLFG
jgi:threonine aldolase